jgi:hypothetical protein
VPDETITVTLPANDFQTIIAGLLELPGKYGNPVIGRLQAELQQQTKTQPMLKEVSDA